MYHIQVVELDYILPCTSITLQLCIGEPPRIEGMNSTSYTNGILAHTISMVTASMHMHVGM